MSRDATVLILGSYPENVYKSMKQSKYRFIHFPQANDLHNIINQHHFDLVITSYRMQEHMNGFAVIKMIKKFNTEIPILFTTGSVQPRTIIQAMKLGANDYIVEPFDFSMLELAIKENLQHLRDHRKIQYLEKKLEHSNPDLFIAESFSMQTILQQTEDVKNSSSHVLITGENGTGKGVLAKHIHHRSRRGNGPFIETNCGALSESLLENELFGHEKGAYTGADKTAPGVFELAHSGSLFLDEIGTINESFQVKLLKVLEDKKFRRVGGNNEVISDVRIIAATNLDLKQAVEDGLFRKDLYFRLNILHFHLPPLRDRKEDLPKLVDSYLKQFRKEIHDRITSISPNVLEIFQSYPWPGNIRELRNILERAFLMTKGDCIEVDSLPNELMTTSKIEAAPAHLPPTMNPTAQLPSTSFNLDQYLVEQEKDVIEKALFKLRWNKSKTAKYLGLKRTTLVSRMKKYNIQ